METPSTLVETLYERAETYSKTSYDLAKLKSLETTVKVTTSLISRLSVIIAVIMFLLFSNIGIAMLLGDLFKKNYYGFFAVSAFYLVLGIVFHVYIHRWIKKPISDWMITEALN